MFWLAAEKSTMLSFGRVTLQSRPARRSLCSPDNSACTGMDSVACAYFCVRPRLRHGDAQGVRPHPDLLGHGVIAVSLPAVPPAYVIVPPVHVPELEAVGVLISGAEDASHALGGQRGVGKRS